MNPVYQTECGMAARIFKLEQDTVGAFSEWDTVKMLVFQCPCTDLVSFTDQYAVDP